MKNRLFFLFSLFLFGVEISVESADFFNKYRFLQLSHSEGLFVGNKDAPLQANHAWGFDLRAGWQADERNASYADSLFLYPMMGVGLYYGNLSEIHLGEAGNFARLGTNVALYGFYKNPIHRTKCSEWDLLVGFGLSGGHTTWDKEENPKNTITSTFLNYFILLRAEYRYAVSDHSSLGLGVSLRHSSNGGFRQPNRGLNLLSIDASYRFDEKGNFERKYAPLTNVNFQRKWDCSVSVGYGLQQLEKSDRMLLFDQPEYRFSNVTLSSRLMYRLFPKRKFGVGLDVFYSEAGSYLEQVFFHRKEWGDPAGRPEHYYLSQQLNGALVLAHEYGYGKWWLLTDAGVYFRPFNGYVTEQKTRFYERVGVKYRFSERFFASLAVRAYIVSAIHSELAVGTYLWK